MVKTSVFSLISFNVFVECTGSYSSLLSVKQCIRNNPLSASFLYIPNKITLVIFLVLPAVWKFLLLVYFFTTVWIFFDFHKIGAYFLWSLWGNTISLPRDDEFFRFAKCAPAKQNMFHSLIHKRFGNCNDICSDFNFLILLAF